MEPQYDSTGEFPLAVLHHYLLTGDETFLATVRGRVRELLGFFIDNVRAPRGSGRASITRNALCGGGATFPRVQVEYAGFVPSDYSIWEESSSGLTGKPLPTSYFSFTQSMAYAGLQAGALLEEHTWVNTTAAAELRARASQVVAAVENKLWLEDEGYYARDIWSNTLLVRCRGRCVCVVVTLLTLVGACTNPGGRPPRFPIHCYRVQWPSHQRHTHSKPPRCHQRQPDARCARPCSLHGRSLLLRQRVRSAPPTVDRVVVSARDPTVTTPAGLTREDRRWVLRHRRGVS